MLIDINSAILFVFKPVNIYNTKYVDSEVKRNLGATSGKHPLEKCLILRFDRGEVKPSTFKTIQGQITKHLLGTKMDLNDSAARIAAQNNIPGYVITIPYASLSTFNMNPTQKEIEKAVISSFQTTVEQITHLEE
jgi:hypothetical protein